MYFPSLKPQQCLVDSAILLLIDIWKLKWRALLLYMIGGKINLKKKGISPHELPACAMNKRYLDYQWLLRQLRKTDLIMISLIYFAFLVLQKMAKNKFHYSLPMKMGIQQLPWMGGSLLSCSCITFCSLLFPTCTPLMYFALCHNAISKHNKQK